MVIHFFIKYKTRFGQSVWLINDNKIQGESFTSSTKHDILLEYYDEEYWYGKISALESGEAGAINYRYLVKEAGEADKQDFGKRVLNLKKADGKEINVYDDWQENVIENEVFNTKPFLNIFGKNKVRLKEYGSKNPSHIFEVLCNQLPEQLVLCIIGSSKKMNAWDAGNPVFLKKRKHYWTVKLNLKKENFPLEYKFALYDTQHKKIIFFEPGKNRVLNSFDGRAKINLLHQYVLFPDYHWKAAGVNVQLSALKTKDSWGIGDFSDLNLLTDWAQETGMKLIQLLPVNDTTAQHDQRDSYPYSAISAFALHPVFLNIQKIATAVSLEFPEEVIDQITILNSLPQLDYEAVWKIKREAIRELYEKDKLAFKDDFGYFDFFDLNRHWLVPYAAFSYLRDKYETPDFNRWEAFAVYDEDQVQEFVSPNQPHYDDIAIHYFTQYHLHLQLMDAMEYAHKKEIILKGDLPIGVGRFSADTWMNPALFYMDMQAGAPPDAFAVKGQNWSFPTYNWKAMHENHYAWWRQRLEHLGNYFDAIRIDHVLGFFRIWSIPMHAVEGIFGRFMPVHPVFSYDLETAGLNFNEDRFCKPWISYQLIDEMFAENSAWVRETFLNANSFKAEFNTEQKIASWFNINPEKRALRKKLFDLLANVILLKDDYSPHQYHFRINMQATTSYKNLTGHEQYLLNELYTKYFFENQNELWFKEAGSKLDAIQNSTNMLVCAEDLGMVPAMVEDVLKSREILALQVERMPKKASEDFTNPADAPYMCVVTPSTHDMSTMRQWWEEDQKSTQNFFNKYLFQSGTAPFYCEPWICREIILQHLKSPAMWAVFLLQDLIGMDGNIRREDPAAERINDPANPNHYWNYRMHISLESLIAEQNLSADLRSMITGAGR